MVWAIGSVQNMLKRIGAQCIVTSDIKEIERQKNIIPGVGAFDAAIQKIDELDLRPILIHKAREKNTFSWYMSWNAIINKG